MKLSPQLLVIAQLTALAACDYMPEDVMDVTARKFLNGTEALDYLFKYDPSRPHASDGDFFNSGPSQGEPAFKYRNYDANYIERICAPRSWTGEASADVDWEFMSNQNFTGDDQREEYIKSYEYTLNVNREGFSESPYPCERRNWIAAECGINGRGWGKEQVDGKGTPKEQNDCLCRSDYWAADEACSACHILHAGNKTLGAEHASVRSAVSDAVCAEIASVTVSIFEYWTSQYPWEGRNTTIISDGAQNQTDVSLYYTGGVDFVPATIQEPAFTRTIGGKTVVMTPGVLAAKATAAATVPATTGGSATGSVAAGATSKAAAADARVHSGLLFAVFGAFMMV